MDIENCLKSTYSYIMKLGNELISTLSNDFQQIKKAALSTQIEKE